MERPPLEGRGDQPPPGPLDRLHRLFSDVRAGESGTVLLLFANLFLLLSAYWLHLNARGFALTNLAVVVAWIFVALVLVREHRALVAGGGGVAETAA